MKKIRDMKPTMSTRIKNKSKISLENKSVKSTKYDTEIHSLSTLFREPKIIIDNEKITSILSSVLTNILKLVSAKSGFIIEFAQNSRHAEIILVNSTGRTYLLNRNHHDISTLFGNPNQNNRVINHSRISKILWKQLIPENYLRVENARITPLIYENRINGYLCICNKSQGFSRGDTRLLKNVAGIISALIYSNQNLQLSQESIQKHMEMFNSLNQGIAIIDNTARIIFANSGVCEMLGYAKEELSNKSLFDFINNKDIKVVKSVLSGIKDNIRDKCNFRLVHKTGINIHTSPDIIPLYNDKGIYLGSIMNIQEATDKKAFNKALLESEQRFRDLANLIPLIVFEIDKNGKFIFINSLACDTIGYSIKELQHMDIFQLLSKTDRTKLMSIMSKKRAINKENNNYYTALKKDGFEFPVILNMTPITTNNKSSGWRGVIIDMSDRERNEARRAELEQKAVMASHLASIGELASGIAHEVNNPLASIVLYSQLLIEENLPDNIKRDVMSIYESAVRATNIIRRLLTFARQQLQKRMPVNINDIVEVTLELRKYALETSNIKVKTILDSQLPFTMADAVQLQEVFLNIILNAETEMKLYRGKGNLLIKTEKSNDKIVISFKDDGPGITKENLSKIFNPFFTTRQVGEGTGLGLSICHGIIIEHDGRIYAESEPNKGTTFYIELPIIKRIAYSTRKDSVATKRKKLTRSKILVIDDEIGILDSLSRILAKHGHKVETTDNCEEALRMIKNTEYNYILLDVKLPGMSGIDMFNQLKKEDASVVNKLAIITGDTMEPDTQAFLEYAKVPCFVKPFDTKNFIRELNSLIYETQ
jgi:PAS domain S-box-containing protein